MTWRVFLLLTLILSPIGYLFPAYHVLADTPALSLQFYGTVYDNNTVVGEGYAVAAMVNGVQKTSVLTDAQGRYGYETPFLVNCVEGQVIKFYVDNKAASQDITCTASPARLLNLYVTGANTATQTITTNMLGKTEDIVLNYLGLLTTGRELSSPDGKVKLRLADNTTINLQGSATLAAANESNPPPSTDNYVTLRAYALTPNGTTFSQPATLKLSYETAWLPPGASESSLLIAFWTGSSWSSLTSTCNTASKVVSAPVSHFTTFAIRVPKPAPRTVNANILGKTDNITLTGNVLSKARNLSSADSHLTISLADNTTITLPAGQQLTVMKLASLPAAPLGVKILEAFSLDPDGAAFNPKATLTIKYTSASLPADVQEASLYIALFSNSNWTPLPSTVNTKAKTVAATLDHFSIYGLAGKVSAVSAPAETAKLTASNLKLSSETAVPGENVTVSIMVANTGTASGSQTYTLKVNDKNEAQKTVTVGAGKSQAVTFFICKNEPGIYRVAIGDLTGSYEVKPAGLSWPWIVGLCLGGLLIVILVGYFIFRKK